MQIAVYYGACTGDNSSYLELASCVGKALALSNHSIVYGGSSLGMMGALAHSALNHSSHVVGVLLEYLIGVDIPFPGLTELKIVQSWSERKVIFLEADAFLVLPGGIGTLEELFET